MDERVQFVMNVCEAHDDRHRNAPEPPHAQEAFAEYCAYVEKLERELEQTRRDSWEMNCI